MGIENKLKGAVVRATTAMFSGKEGMLKYLERYRLKDYFADKTEEEQKRLRGSLEEQLDKSINEYDKVLHGMLRKGIVGTTMAGAVANDWMAYKSLVPIKNAQGIRDILFTVKMVAEIPALYRYMKKSHDWYGLGAYILMKPVDYVLAFLGPLIEAKVLTAIAKNRVMKETEIGFKEKEGSFKPVGQRFEDYLGQPIGERVNLGRKYAYSPAPVMAAA